MPTPAGKPKVGETIEWYEAGEVYAEAKVLQRSDGTSWSVKVEWTTGPVKGQTRWITEAQYWMDRKSLRIKA